MKREQMIEIIAATCHCSARAFAISQGIFDATQWQRASEHLKQEATEGVEFVLHQLSETDDVPTIAERLHEKRRKALAENPVTRNFAVEGEPPNETVSFQSQSRMEVPPSWEETLHEQKLKVILFVENVITMSGVVGGNIFVRGEAALSSG